MGLLVHPEQQIIIFWGLGASILFFFVSESSGNPCYIKGSLYDQSQPNSFHILFMIFGNYIQLIGIFSPYQFAA